MSSSVGRNDPCPCGSGKKYKHCHLGREHELALETDEEGNKKVVSVGSRTPTWKIFLGVLGVIVVISGAIWIAGFARIGQIAGGVATLVLVIWAAFRSPPPRRDDAGTAEAINFGMK